MLNKYEELLEEAAAQNISVDENFPFHGNLKGLYVDQNIALSDQLETSAEKACILAEELGHHYTSVGNILDISDPANAKQERQARMWTYERLIGLRGLIDAYQHGCREYHETAEFLDVTEEQLRDAIADYRSKYGICTKYQNYYIMFEPYLMIGKKNEDNAIVVLIFLFFLQKIPQTLLSMELNNSPSWVRTNDPSVNSRMLCR